ncbi:MAG: kelch repeat-containing protein [Candidatus Limnocylindrales bacterium]|jgi:hypothetical protein
MNRRISQQDLETEIRSYLAGAGAPEPASLGDVLDRLPDRAGASRWSSPRVAAFPSLVRFAAVAIVLSLVAAAVGLPLMLSRPGPIAPGQTSSPESSVASPSPVATATLAAGTFVPTGSMMSSRSGATATLLSDGRVLIAGGWGDNSTPLASAELYDPATGKFSPTGSMTTARNGTATLLPDGRVLFAGGTDDTGTIASAELYDPSTGKFSLTGSMTVARASQTATLLPTGRVLIAGGAGRDGMALGSAELYDPATGKFSPTGSMTVARMTQAATLLSDGRVLIAGGATTTGTPATGIHASALTSAELYDSATGKFSPTGSMTAAREGPITTLLSDGRVLVTGGSDQVGALVSAELYDPATGRFSLTGSMTIGQSLTTATRLSDGRVLIAGGWVPFAPLATIELYDPSTGTFSPTGSMSTGRSGPTATLLPDGRVLIAGGVGAGNAALASAELYQP